LDGHASTGTQKQLIDQDELDQLCINTIRFLAVDAVQKANSGHPGLPMGDAPLAYVLWTRFFALRSTQTSLAEPGPLCALGRAWLDASVQPPSLNRL